VKGDRIAIIGENGCGMTTLLKIINGIVEPDNGEVRLGARVSIGYYDQSVANLHEEKDILSEIYDDFPNLELTYIRKICGVFLFTGDDVFKTIASLSGGEKARVMLIKLMLRHDNLLLLDEPTNHLDMASKEILESALENYNGTLITVSHDRYFINRIADYVYVMEGSKITKYIGNYDDYIEKINMDESELESNGQLITKTALEKQQKKEKEAQKEQKEHKNKLKALETEIEELEQKKTELEQLLATEEIYKDSKKLKEMNIKYEETLKRLDEATEEWIELSE
ncbi:MAG: ABC-F family ATP-binding cassette domain-containing protein, partial [Ruminococcus sp.]|nr:ABC-F family ATP-binding cassette domain-containing protein [Candidatus Copronaster equi]